MRRFLIVPLIVVAALAVALLDPSNGLRRWRALRVELAKGEARIAALHVEAQRLRIEKDRLRDDPVAIESAIRADLDLARPGEVVIRLGEGRGREEVTP